MIRRSFIINNNLRFNEDLSLCEDLLFNASLMKYNPKVEYLDNAFYHYDQYTNQQSLVRTYNRKTFEKDENMFAIFNEVFSYNFNLRKVVNNNMGNLLVVRAYSNQSLIEKIVLYLSCVGFYSISEPLRKCLTSIRNVFNYRGH